MSDNIGTSRIQLNSFDEEGHRRIRREIQIFADQIDPQTFLEFARLFLEIPDRIIDKILRQNITKEDLYRMLRESYDTNSEWFIAIVRKYRPRIKSDTYLKIDRCIRQDRNEIPENLLVEVIYKLIKAIPIKERRNFAENEIGIRNQEHRNIQDVQITSDLKLHFLEWWWENIGQREQNAIAELRNRANDGGYLMQQSELNTIYCHLTNTVKQWFSTFFSSQTCKNFKTNFVDRRTSIINQKCHEHKT
uniref:uncharacterized protein LOC120348251 isoform X2 n=1 Tax=Styela clava TaxID=7725 RepID=UPI0019392A8A|nr:uncharacterized protein LOC120348251 isoform X2 [Styela clava]